MTSTWSELHRHISWSLLTYSRGRLKIGLDTCVATAFMMVHNYFLVKQSSPYSLFIILVTALFSSCKMNENVRTMQQIYSELLNCCRDASNRIGLQRLIDNLGRDNFDNCAMTAAEVNEVGLCELDLLEANGFNMKIDLPFKHTDQFVNPYYGQLPPEVLGPVKNKLVMNICKLLCYQKTAEMPACVLAVAATKNAFGEICAIPHETESWMMRVEEEYGIEVIQQAQEELVAKTKPTTKQTK
jgi:hypothetical protein